MALPSVWDLAPSTSSFFSLSQCLRQAPRILSTLALVGWHCGLGGVGPAQTKWGREKAGPTDHCGGHMAHPMPSQTPRSPSQVRAAPSALVPGRPSHQYGWLCVCVSACLSVARRPAGSEGLFRWARPCVTQAQTDFRLYPGFASL